MAVRLSVILIQTRPPSAKAQRLAEEVVGELIGFRGIDLVLVEPVRGLAESSTDRLTLGSLSGDVAVLDWKSPQDLFSDLESIDFEGARAVHAHDQDPSPSPPGKRKIYLFDLATFDSAQELMDALSQLQSTRQVRTFTLGSGSPGQASSNSGANGKSVPPKSKAGHSASAKRPEPLQVPTEATINPPLSPPGPGDAPTSTTVPLSSHDSSSDSPGDRVDLDSLIDELDQIDP